MNIKSNNGKQVTKSKRKQKKISLPYRLKEIDSLELVPSPFGPIETPIVSSVDKDIIIDRLNKEILKKFRFSFSASTAKLKQNENQSRYYLGSNSAKNDNESQEKGPKCQKIVHDSKKDNLTSETLVCKKRIIIGTNQCTRALEAALLKKETIPSLIIMARDLRPPTILAHVPVMCKVLNVEILLLPGMASYELGQHFGTRTVSIIAFLPDLDVDGGALGGKTEQAQIQKCNKCINSYINFAKSKLNGEKELQSNNN